VNEKIKSQQLSNELEKLHGELERVGINKEKLVMAEPYFFTNILFLQCKKNSHVLVI
jgi:hypothetical protein